MQITIQVHTGSKKKTFFAETKKNRNRNVSRPVNWKLSVHLTLFDWVSMLMNTAAAATAFSLFKNACILRLLLLLPLTISLFVS